MSRNDKPQQDVEKPWWFPGWPRLPALRDVVTHAIALGVLGYTGVVLWGSLLSGTDEGLRHAREVYAVLGTAVGAVLGYYFGANAGERVAREAARRTEAAIEAQEATESVSREELRTAQQQLDEDRVRLQEISDALEERQREDEDETGR